MPLADILVEYGSRVYYNMGPVRHLKGIDSLAGLLEYTYNQRAEAILENRPGAQ